MRSLMYLAVGAVLLASGAVAMLSGCAGPGQEQIVLKPRPATHGWQLPYPVRMPEFHPDTAVTHRELIKAIRLVFAVNAEGRVDSVSAVRKRDSAIVRFYRSSLTSVRLEPGVRGGLAAPMRVPVVMYVGALGTTPVLRFPVEADRGVTNTDLYQEALAKNGLQPPSLVYFPSYSCTKYEEYESKLYRMALIRVELDADGRPTEVVPVVSTCEGYADQLSAACLWARYTPAKIDGVATPYTAWLFVAFFPSIPCPTIPLLSEGSAVWSLQDKMRVRLFADTIGLAEPPLPVRAWTGMMSKADVTSLELGRESVLLSVDTLGGGRAQVISPLPDSAKPAEVLSWKCRRVTNTLYRMYPAVDFRGRPQPFSGLMHMALEGQDSIRISVDWLTNDRFLDVP